MITKNKARAASPLAHRRERRVTGGGRADENQWDATLITHVAFTPLDVLFARGDGPLAAAVGQHNDVLTRLRGLFARLIEDRQALGDIDRCRGAKGATLDAERRRVEAQGWDALAAAERALGEREALLDRLARHIEGRHVAVLQERQRALTGARRRLEQQYQGCLALEPVIGRAHVEWLADCDPAVVHWNLVATMERVFLEEAEEVRRQTRAGFALLRERQRAVFDARRS